MKINIERYPSTHPSKAKLKALLNVGDSGHVPFPGELGEAFRKFGVPVDPRLSDDDFPMNLMPGSKVEYEYDSKHKGCMIVRYYGPLNEVNQPAAKPFDEDDEL